MGGYLTALLPALEGHERIDSFRRDFRSAWRPKEETRPIRRSLAL